MSIRTKLKTDDTYISKKLGAVATFNSTKFRQTGGKKEAINLTMKRLGCSYAEARQTVSRYYNDNK